MVSYKIEWKKSAQKELRKLEKDTILKVLDVVALLSNDPWPQGSRKLRGGLNNYRIRVADYRIVYCVKSDVLTVQIIRVGHRKEIYRRLP